MTSFTALIKAAMDKAAAAKGASASGKADAAGGAGTSRKGGAAAGAEISLTATSATEATAAAGAAPAPKAGAAGAGSEGSPLDPLFPEAGAMVVPEGRAPPETRRSKRIRVISSDHESESVRDDQPSPQRREKNKGKKTATGSRTSPYELVRAPGGGARRGSIGEVSSENFFHPVCQDVHRDGAVHDGSVPATKWADGVILPRDKAWANALNPFDFSARSTALASELLILANEGRARADEMLGFQAMKEALEEDKARFARNLKESLEQNEKLVLENSLLTAKVAEMTRSIEIAQTILSDNEDLKKKVRELEEENAKLVAKSIEDDDRRRVSVERAEKAERLLKTEQARFNWKVDKAASCFQELEEGLGLSREAEGPVLDIKGTLARRIVDGALSYKTTLKYMADMGTCLQEGFGLAQRQFQREYPDRDPSFFNMLEPIEGSLADEGEGEKADLLEWASTALEGLGKLRSPFPDFGRPSPDGQPGDDPQGGGGDGVE